MKDVRRVVEEYECPFYRVPLVDHMFEGGQRDGIARVLRENDNAAYPCSSVFSFG